MAQRKDRKIGGFMSIYVMMIFMAVIFIGLPIMLIANIFRRGKPGVCGNCGHRGESKMHTRGSMAMEIVLWLLFIVPGLVYSIWRLTTKQEVCPECGAPNMVPPNSPRGKQLMAQFSKTA